MQINVFLTPHFEQFVREQMAHGGFQSEDEVICAALRLLEDRARSQVPTALRNGLSSNSASKSTTGTFARRSPRGLLADLPSHIGPDELRSARDEVWSRFPPARHD